MLCSGGFISVCSGALQVRGGGSLRMTAFVWAFETDNQHSCLCTSSCGRVGRCPSELWTDSVTWSRIWTSLEPLFPLAPAAARTPGKTGMVRTTNKQTNKKKRDGAWVNVVFVLMCNFLELSWLHPLCVYVSCRASRPESPLGFTPCRAASVSQWLSGCVTLQLKQMLFLFIYRENYGRCQKCSIQHLDSGNMYSWDGNCWFKLLSFPRDVLFLAAWSYFHTSVCAFAWKRTGCWENIAGREAWWGKPGGVLSGIATCKWFHLSHVSQRILLLLVHVCISCFGKMEMSFWLLFFPQRTRKVFSGSFHSDPVIPVLLVQLKVFFAYIWVSFPCRESTLFPANTTKCLCLFLSMLYILSLWHGAFNSVIICSFSRAVQGVDVWFAFEPN